MQLEALWKSRNCLKVRSYIGDREYMARLAKIEGGYCNYVNTCTINTDQLTIFRHSE